MNPNDTIGCRGQRGSRWVITNGHTMHAWRFEGWQPAREYGVGMSRIGVLIAALKGRDVEVPITIEDTSPVPTLRLNTVSVSCQTDAGCAEFPPWHRVVPRCDTSPQTNTGVCFDPRYVASAMTAIDRIPEFDRFVNLRIGEPLDPIRVDARGYESREASGSTKRHPILERVENSGVHTTSVIMPMKMEDK